MNIFKIEFKGKQMYVYIVTDLLEKDANQTIHQFLNAGHRNDFDILDFNYWARERKLEIFAVEPTVIKTIFWF